MSALAVTALSRAFGGLAVTSDVSLALAPGERVALIGPNGAGKTTLVNLIAGALRPDAGRIALGATDITRAPEAARARAGLVRSFQVSRLFPDLTVLEHVTLALLRRDNRCADLLAPALGRPRVTAEATAILTGLGIAPLAPHRVAAIAYGQQRLVEIAMALALRPKVLLLDEPAAGVPLAESGRILAALQSLPPTLAVLMVEHDMDLVSRFASRIIVLAAGRIIADGPPAAIMADPTVRAAYLGTYADAPRAA